MNSSSIPSLTALAPSLATPPAALTRGGKAAQEFEAQLLASLLNSLEKTFAAVPGDNAIPGQDNYDYLGTQALASALAARGGFGIAAMITRHLGEHEGHSQGADFGSNGGTATL
jgi:Rod binding domain-containing protein